MNSFIQSYCTNSILFICWQTGLQSAGIKISHYKAGVVWEMASWLLTISTSETFEAAIIVSFSGGN